MRTVMLGLVGASLLVGLSGVASASIYQDPLTGNFFEPVAVPTGITWDAANAAAQSAGGYLAIVNSFEENQYVYSLIASSSSYWTTDGTNIGPWLGGQSLTSNTAWKWVDGSFLPATNPTPLNSTPFAQWYAGQPDGYGGQPEGIVYWDGGAAPASGAAYWGDSPYDYTNNGAIQLPHGYVIEFAAVPEPATIIIWSLLGGLSIAVAHLRRRNAA